MYCFLANRIPLIFLLNNNTGCGPCKRISPQVDQLSYKYQSVRFVKVDVDKQSSIAQQCGIASMPTFHFYRNSAKLDSFSGADINKLEEKILAHSPSSSSPSQTTNSTITFTHLAQGSTFFDSGKLEQVASKLKEFSTSHCLDQQSSVKEAVITNIQKTLSNSTMYHSSSFSQEEMNSVQTMVKEWPENEKFASLDLLRFFVLHPEGAKSVVKDKLIPYVVFLLKNGIPMVNGAYFKPLLISHFSCFQNSINKPATVMGLRFLANSFK